MIIRSFEDAFAPHFLTFRVISLWFIFIIHPGESLNLHLEYIWPWNQPQKMVKPLHKCALRGLYFTKKPRKYWLFESSTQAPSVGTQPTHACHTPLPGKKSEPSLCHVNMSAGASQRFYPPCSSLVFSLPFQPGIHWDAILWKIGIMADWCVNGPAHYGYAHILSLLQTAAAVRPHRFSCISASSAVDTAGTFLYVWNSLWGFLFTNVFFLSCALLWGLYVPLHFMVNVLLHNIAQLKQKEISLHQNPSHLEM